MSERGPGYDPTQESQPQAKPEMQQSVERPAFEKRFVTPAELAEYRKAIIKEGGLYQIARGMLVYPRFDNIDPKEHERLMAVSDPARMTPYVRGYQAAAAANKLDQIGQVTNLHTVSDPVMPNKKLTVATISYPDGVSIDVASLNLGRPSPTEVENQGLGELYRDRYSFEKDGHRFVLGNRVLVDGLFIGILRAIWPQGQNQPPSLGIQATEQHFVADPNNPGTYAPKMRGEKVVYLRLSADRVGLAPEPAIFTSNIRILDEN